MIAHCARARRRWLLGCSLGVICLALSGCWGLVAHPVPLHSPTERVMEQLDAEGLAQSHIAGVRPYSRMDLERLLEEGREAILPDASGKTDEARVARYENLAAAAESEGFYSSDPILPSGDLELFPASEPYTRFTWISGSPRTENLAGSPVGPILDKPTFAAIQTYGPGRIVNDDGRIYNEGLNVHTGMRSTVQVWEWLVLTFAPEFQFNEDERFTGQADGEFILRRANARIEMGPWELEIGRDSLWWGPGRHGSLLLSNNAEPFDLVKIENRDPILLPGFLSRLGPVRLVLFATELGEARIIPDAILGGMRVEVKPTPNVTVGASRTFLFGGDGRSEDLDTIIDVLLVKGENDPGGPGDQLASLDLRVRLPFRTQPVVLYIEQGGEDEAGNLPARHAYLGGVYLPRLGGLPVELRAEYANTHVSQAAYFWYSHATTYWSGYTYKGRVIGHHIGTDAEELSLEIGATLFGRARVKTMLRSGRRNLSLDPKEEFFSYGLELTWPLSRRGVLRAGYYHESFKNFGLEPGREENVDYGIFSILWPF